MLQEKYVEENGSFHIQTKQRTEITGFTARDYDIQRKTYFPCCTLIQPTILMMFIALCIEPSKAILVCGNCLLVRLTLRAI